MAEPALAPSERPRLKRRLLQIGLAAVVVAAALIVAAYNKTRELLKQPQVLVGTRLALATERPDRALCATHR